MNASFITQWISEPVVRALCWMLIHSLWIGLITAGLAGAVMVGTQKTTARLRYQLLCGTFLVFVGLTGLMGYREWTMHSLDTSLNSVAIAASTIQSISPLSATLTIDELSLVERASVLINQEAGWIFAVWLLFFLIKSLKLMGGLYYIHRIRTQKIHPLGDEWKTKIASFSRTLGIQRTITLLQSELVNVPVTVGMLKPVILLPVGLIFQLSPQQIDTILWHELAHIWRRDYLMNLLQHLVETVFFFNPGLLWVSSLIREEREVCCDELVLAHTTSKTHYVEALLAFQGVQSTSSMALGLGGHPLVNRLKRMVTQENKRLSVGEKIVLLAGFVLFSAFTMVRSADPEPTPNRAPAKALAKKAQVQFDRPFATQTVKAQGTLATLPVVRTAQDTVPISPQPTRVEEAVRQFTSIRFVSNNRDLANREMLVQDDKANRYQLTVVDGKLTTLSINEVAVPQTELEQYGSLLDQIDQALAEKERFKRETVAASVAQAEAERQAQLQQWKEAQQRKRDKYPQPDNNKKLPPVGKAKDGLPKSISSKTKSVESPVTTFKKKHLAGMKADTAAKTRSWSEKKHPPRSDNSYDRQRVLGVINALVEQKVVADPSAVDWFGLSETELVVNGVRQSDELQQKLKTQYGIKPEYGLFYGPIQMVGKGIIFEKSDM